jgi:hypothetical protein
VQLKLTAAPDDVQYAGTVVASWELKRSLGLPRRVLDLEKVEDVSPLFCRFEGPKALRFWPIQNAALIEAAICDGLFAMIGVGWGKTLIALLLPDVMQSIKAVYLVKPDLKKQLEREIDEFYLKHFDIPIDRIHIVAYSELSSTKNAEILDEIKPDLIIADEAHCLKNPKSNRTKRFLRFMDANPSCRFAALSGTMTTRSLTEYAHLIELALRKNSPLPKSYYELRAWAGALDVNPSEHFHPGALEMFCAPGESIEDGFRRRITETPGVVATQKEEIGTALYIQPRLTKVPRGIQEIMRRVQTHWCLEDEENEYKEEFTDATQLWSVLRQLACGFYYVWKWPNDEPNREWLEARSNWNREVREKLKRSGVGMDSPHLLAQAAQRYSKWLDSGCKGPRPEKSWDSAYWEDWRVWKDTPPPPVEAVWLDDFLIRASLSWAKNLEAAIIWYEHRAVGEKLGEFLPLYGPGDDAGLADPDREKVIVCSIRAQGTGKNLQRFSRNLFTSLPPNGSTFEQTTGRTHRNGQLSDDVLIDYFEHSGSESFEKILKDAEYVEKTTGDRQKALYATYLPPKSLRP